MTDLQTVLVVKGGARERAQFSPQAETELSGLCDDARTTPERCISAPLETDALLPKLIYH